MADVLKLAQLSTLLAQQGQQGTAFNPGMNAYMQSLIGSGQSATQAEAQKKAEKDAKKKNGLASKILPMAGTVVGGMFGGPVGASLGGMAGTAAGGAVDGGGVDPGAVATAGVSGYMGQAKADGVEGFNPAQGTVPNQLPINPTAPNAKPTISPMASGPSPADGAPFTIGDLSTQATANVPSPMASSVAAPAVADAQSLMAGGNGMADLMKYAPLIGAAGGFVTGGKDAYTGDVSSPKRPGQTMGAPGADGQRNALRSKNFSTMTPEEAKKLSDTDKQLLYKYMSEGGSLTPEQAAALPRDMKKVMRGQGYEGMPQRGDMLKSRLQKALMGLAIGSGVQSVAGGGGMGKLLPTGAGTFDYQ